MAGIVYGIGILFLLLLIVFVILVVRMARQEAKELERDIKEADELRPSP